MQVDQEVVIWICKVWINEIWISIGCKTLNWKFKGPTLQYGPTLVECVVYTGQYTQLRPFCACFHSTLHLHGHLHNNLPPAPNTPPHTNTDNMGADHRQENREEHSAEEDGGSAQTAAVQPRGEERKVGGAMLPYTLETLSLMVPFVADSSCK